MVSCSSSDTEEYTFSSPNVGALSIQTPLVNNEIPVLITKSANFDVLNPDNFIIEIYKQGESNYYKRYETFTQLKQEGTPLELPIGDYILKTFSCNPVAMLRDMPYFVGSKTFTIVAHEISTVSVECKYQSIGVEIVLTDKFKSFFKDTYKIVISTDSGLSAIYSKETPERVYLTENCNYIKVSVDCTTKDNEVYPTRAYYFNKDGIDPNFNGDGPFTGEYFIIKIDTDNASGKAMIK